jgi:Na+/H+ antiporter NhaB
MKAVHKYTIKPFKNQDTVIMPVGAQIIDVKIQHDVPTIWAIVDTSPDVPKEARFFTLLPTGSAISNDMVYVDTIHINEGNALVFHLFETSNNNG